MAGAMPAQRDQRKLWRDGRRRTSRHHFAAALVPVLAATQCAQQDTSDWLTVDNRTDSRIVITERDEDGLEEVGSIGPQAEGFGVGGRDFCDSRALEARLESIDGRVIDRRPGSDGESCEETWVIEPD